MEIKAKNLGWKLTLEFFFNAENQVGLVRWLQEYSVTNLMLHFNDRKPLNILKIIQ